MSLRSSMKSSGTQMGLVVLLGLAACPSPTDPPGGDTDTETGTTTMSPTTSVDTTETAGSDCGNGMIDGEEECDGSELGGAECADVNPAYSGGTLACGATCTFDASGCELPPGTPLVTLNEVTSESVLEGDFMGLNDALELHNAGTGPADLSGWQISDDMTLLPERTYVMPDGTMLDPGDFMVLRTFDMLTMTGELPFGISDSMVETLVLADPSDGMVDSVVVDGYLARVSYCRVPDGNGPWFQCDQTFGSENLAADTACGNGTAEAPAEECDGEDLASGTCEDLGLGFSGGTLTCRPTCFFDADACTTDSELVINEVSSTTDGIELFNGSVAAVDLTGWVLTDERVEADYDVALDMEELVFDGVVLAPGEYYVVTPGLGPNQHPFGLGAMGDRVTLLDPTSPPTIIDQVSYELDQAALSWCRQPNGPGGVFEECTPSMGAAN